MQLRGYRIMNMDVTLILQQPRVAKFKPAMKVPHMPSCRVLP
jgi:2C-methyl-D-erythritol 2,4-cyclodiphosphate synthase